MNVSRKPRGDSKLKTLDPEVQKAIFERCEGGKYKAVVPWLLAEFDVETSVGALSEFYSWYLLKQRVDAADNHVQDIEELINSSGLQVDPNKLRDAMSGILLAEASKSGDFKTFRGVCELLIKAEKNSIERGKLELMQKKALALDMVAEAMKSEPGEEDTAEDVQRRVMDVIDEVMGIRKKPATTTTQPS